MKPDETPMTCMEETAAKPGGTILDLCTALYRLLKPGIRTQGCLLTTAYLIALVGIGATFFAPWFLSLVLDKALPHRDMKLFLLYSGAVLLSLLVSLFCSLLKTYCLSRASEKMFLDLRMRMVSGIIRKPSDFFARHESGDLITRVSNDTEYLSVQVFDYAYAGLQSLTTIVVSIILMLAWDWHLGLYMALTLPCYALVLSLLQKPLYRAAMAARNGLSRQNESLLDILSGVREIRFFQQYQAAGRRFGNAAEQFTSANIRSVLFGEWGFNTMEIFARLIALLPFLLGGYWICSGTAVLTVGTLIAYNLYLTYIANGFEVINVGMIKLSQAAPLVSRLQEILDYPEEPQPPAKSLAEVMDNTRVEFRNVSFSYDPAKPILNDFSLTIKPGEKVALMGPSGAGKSTIIDLLTRQIRPVKGDILFGGRAIDEYSLPVYLFNFAYVRQNPYIFKTSVRENIAAGWYETPLDLIMDVAKRVRMHEVIMRLPGGYDTVIGADGVTLSGGQMQRLALARALVRDPAVLLLDEFTSALDRETEAEILKDLFVNFAGQTIFCVTHSAAVADHFPRIVRIEKL